jgi:hypothetical protein
MQRLEDSDNQTQCLLGDMKVPEALVIVRTTVIVLADDIWLLKFRDEGDLICLRRSNQLKEVSPVLSYQPLRVLAEDEYLLIL